MFFGVSPLHRLLLQPMLRLIYQSIAGRWLKASYRSSSVVANVLSRSSPEEMEGSAMRQSLVTLDRELRRFGRIRTDHYTNALNDAVEHKLLTAQHAVLLLRSLGLALSDEAPELRVSLAKTLWRQLEPLGVKPDIGLFNALLQTYIENDHFEQPSIILDQMKTANVTPNKVTYQRIIGLYCLKGDINAASTVLNHMKNEGHPVNETIFAHLIHGHIRAGDVAGAKSIFETMRKAGIEPTAASFSMLMLGFAERGDMEAIKEARELATNSSCLLLPRDFIPTIISLSNNGQSDKIPQVLELITNHVGYNRDMMAAILQLCALRKFDDAISIFWTLRRPSLSSDAASSESEQSQKVPGENAINQSAPMLFGRFLVRSLIKHRAPHDLIASTMKQMREQGVNSDTSIDAARIAAEFGRADQFREWLRRVNSEEMKSGLRQHMFWPLFRIVDRSDKITVDSVLEVIADMKSLGVNLEHNSFVTLSEFLFPAFARALGNERNLADSDIGVLAKLELAGYNPEHIAFAWTVFLVKRGMMDEVKKHLSDLPRMFISPAYLSEYLAALLRSSSSNLSSVVEALSLLEKNPNIRNKDNIDLLVGRTLIEAIFARKSNEWPSEVINAFVNAGLKPSIGSVKAARSELERRNSSKELLSQLDKIAVLRPSQPNVRSSAQLMESEEMSGDNDKLDASDFNKMSAEQLESALAKAQEMQRPTLRVEKYLLMRYCQFGEVEKAEELKAKLDSRNFIYPPSMLRALLTLAAAHKRSLPESLVLKKKLEAAGGQASPGATIDIAALQIRADKASPEQVICTLQDYGTQQASVLNNRQMGQSLLLYRPASRLIQALIDKGHHKFAAQTLLTLIECGFISPRCQVLGDMCVSAFVAVKDWEGLIDLVETMAQKHKTVIAANDVLSAFIQAGDEQKPKLQRCVEAMSSCQGEMATLNGLIVSLVECGQVAEARKVLDTPGLRALPRYLSWACENLAAKGCPEAITSLIGVVRGLYNADIEDMYFRLIKAYGRQQQSDGSGKPGWQKALGIYDRFEEESIQARPRTLRYLADILVDNNQPVPFQVPASSRQEKSSTGKAWKLNTTSSDDDSTLAILKHVRRAVELLSRGNLEEIVAIRSQLDDVPLDNSANEDSPKPLGTTFIRLLVQQLVDKHSHDLLVRLSSSFAAADSLDDLILIRDVAGGKASQPLPDWCWDKLSTDFVSAHDRAGRIDDCIDSLNDDMAAGELRRYLSPTALSTLRKSSSKSAWDKTDKIIRKSAAEFKSRDSGNEADEVLKSGASMSLLNRFWTTCILTKDLKRAESLEQDFPGLLERPPLAGILRQVKSLPLQTDAIPIFDHLLTSLKNHPNHIAFVLSYILPMLANAGEWAAVNQRVSEMTKCGIAAENLRPFAIAQVQSAAEQSGIELPEELARLPKQVMPEKPTEQKNAKPDKFNKQKRAKVNFTKNAPSEKS